MEAGLAGGEDDLSILKSKFAIIESRMRAWEIENIALKRQVVRNEKRMRTEVSSQRSELAKIRRQYDQSPLIKKNFVYNAANVCENLRANNVPTRTFYEITHDKSIDIQLDRTSDSKGKYGFAKIAAEFLRVAGCNALFACNRLEDTLFVYGAGAPKSDFLSSSSTSSVATPCAIREDDDDDDGYFSLDEKELEKKNRGPIWKEMTENDLIALHCAVQQALRARSRTQTDEVTKKKFETLLMDNSTMNTQTLRKYLYKILKTTLF